VSRLTTALLPYVAVAALAGNVIALGVINGQSRAPSLDPAATYELALTYAGQRYVLDHGLTSDDCAQAMIETKRATSCEVEGR
jgi:hypothetical protein